MRNLSNEVCPAQSHGLYKLHADLTQDPKLSPGMDLVGNAGPDCRVLDPPLPPTWLCVHPPDQDAIISKGIVWRGHWMSDCNEEYRLRTLCAIVRAVRKSGVPHHRSWVLDIGSNIGTFTLPLLAAGVNVVSIEADADNLALLNGSLSAQRRLGAPRPHALGTSVLVGGALAAEEGVELCMERASKFNSGSVQFRDAGLAKMGGATSRSACTRLVRTTTLDAALERTAGLQLGGPDGAVFVALKIDVQGAEAAVLAGATRLLERSPPSKVYIETQNRSLLSDLSASYGYVLQSKSKEGCDYNFRLEHPLRGSSSQEAAGASAGSGANGQGGAAGQDSEGVEAARKKERTAFGGMAAGGKAFGGGSKALQGKIASRVDGVASKPPGSKAGGGGGKANGRSSRGVASVAVSAGVGVANGTKARTRATRAMATTSIAHAEAYTPDPNQTDRFVKACQRGSQVTIEQLLPDMEEWLLVPRLLHQTWKSCEVPLRQRSWWDRCARLSPEWSFALWTDDANRAFVAAHYPQHLSMYDAYNVNIKRVDAIRYMLLYHFGGVYMDLDFACVRSLDSIPLRRAKGAATLILQRKSAADYEAVSNAFMAAPPRHPFFKFVIEQLQGSANARHVLDATGPRFLTRAWRAWSTRKAQAAKDYSVAVEFAPWALLHRVHSCRPQCRPGDTVCFAKPPCPGPYNYAPCKHGAPHELDCMPAGLEPARDVQLGLSWICYPFPSRASRESPIASRITTLPPLPL